MKTKFLIFIISILIISCGKNPIGDIRFYSYYYDYEQTKDTKGALYTFDNVDSLLKKNRISKREFKKFKKKIKTDPVFLNNFLLYIKDCIVTERSLYKNGEKLKKERLKKIIQKSRQLYVLNMRLQNKRKQKNKKLEKKFKPKKNILFNRHKIRKRFIRRK